MAPFKFLDLAAELRNEIYELSLTHDRANGVKAAAGLLRTCRQVYAECKDILYAQSSFTINAEFAFTTVYTSKGGRLRTQNTGTINGDITLPSQPTEMSALDFYHCFPPAMLKVARVDVTVHLGLAPSDLHFGALTHDEDEKLSPASRFIFALCDLMGCEALSRRLFVTIFALKSDYAHVGPTVMRELTRPLLSLFRKPFDTPCTPVMEVIQYRHLQEARPGFPPIMAGTVGEFYRLSELLLYRRDQLSLEGTTYGLAEFCLDTSRSILESTRHRVGGRRSPPVHTYLKAAEEILASSVNQNIAEVQEPPAWLRACQEIPNMKDTPFRPLRHLLHMLDD